MAAPDASIPSLDELESLARSDSLSDRAFAAGVLRLGLSSARRSEVAPVYALIRESAARAHGNLRAELAQQPFNRTLLLAALEGVALELRDHFVEELLGIAYPPLVSRRLDPELVSYSPSGLSELLFMLDQASLGPEHVLVDLGSGLGKVVLLATLLTPARAIGLELDPELVAGARRAAASLGLSRASFVEGDLRELPLPEADVYYMFIPLQRSAQLLARLAPIAAQRGFSLFAQGLDLSQAPWLERTGAACYWLEHFKTRSPGSRLR